MHFTCSQCGSTELSVHPWQHGKNILHNILNKLGLGKLTGSNLPGRWPGGRYVITCKKCGYKDAICVL